MTLPIYQVDAFTSHVFGGNPAAIVPLDKWLSDDLLQKIALENNLSETAFIVKESEGYHIRWFTPVVEVDLCGHATLATAFYLFEIEQVTLEKLSFNSRSGLLTVEKKDNLLVLDFPAMEITEMPAPDGLIEGIGASPSKIFKAKDDWMLVFDDEEKVANLTPNFSLLKSVKARGIITTAPSNDKNIDFISRFFAPASGINEDPVTGSAHSKLIPYWATVLGKTTLIAKQISQREGMLYCEYQNERVKIAGNGVLYLKGEIYI